MAESYVREYQCILVFDNIIPNPRGEGWLFHYRRNLVYPDGIVRGAIGLLWITDEELFQRLSSEVTKGERIDAYTRTDWSLDDLPSTLLDYRKLTAEEVAYCEEQIAKHNPNTKRRHLGQA
jgi:hypothetical protein